MHSKRQKGLANNPWILPVGFAASAIMMVALLAFAAISVQTVASDHSAIVARFNARAQTAVVSTRAGAPVSRVATGARALSQDVESTIDTSGIIGDLHDLPRPYYDLDEGRYVPSGGPNEFPTPGDPDAGPNDAIYYGMGLVFTALYGLILAILTLVIGCVFFTCRCVCGCCGGKQPAKGGYSASSRYFMRIFMYVFGFLVFVTCMVGIGGNIGVRNGLAGLFDTPRAVVWDIGNITLELDAVLESLNGTLFSSLTSGSVQDPPTADLLVQSQAARDFLDQIVGILELSKGYALAGDEYRSLVIQGGYMFTLFCAVLGVVAALTNTAIPAVLMALFAWVGVPMLWLSFSIHYPIAVFGADTCVALDGFLTNDQISGVLTSFCDQADGILDPIVAIINETSTLVDDTIDTVQTVADNQWISLACASNGGYANATCAVINDTLNAAIDDVTEVNDAILAATTAIREIFDCDYLFDLVADLQGALCDDFIGSLGVIFVTQAIGASLLMVGSVVGVKAAKRFPTENQASAVDEAIEATQARKDAAFQAAAGEVVGAAPPGGFQETGGADYYGQKTY